MKNNRRNFLKSGIIGLSGAALLPGSLNASGSVSIIKPKLPTRMLGRTGMNIPLISLGASGTSSPSFVRAAYDAGVKLFFSATYYGDGNNERLVGEGLKGLPRDSFFVGTAAPPDDFDRRTGNFSKEFNIEGYLKKAEESLKRFGLDYVDIFLFPYAGKREMVLNEGVLKAMKELKKQGKAKFVGIASHNDMEEALRAAADSGVYDVAMPSYNYKVQNKDAMADALDYATKAGLGIIAMKTTAGAFRDKNGPGLNTNAALKWVLQNKNIASITSGMSNIDEMEKNLAMINDLKITSDELKDLNLTMNDSRSLYCQQCKSCEGQCPNNLDIPTMMRSYMYAYGYKNMEQAYYTLCDTCVEANPCQDCDQCRVRCASGFDIRERICDISRLRSVPREFLMS